MNKQTILDTIVKTYDKIEIENFSQINETDWMIHGIWDSDLVTISHDLNRFSSLTNFFTPDVLCCSLSIKEIETLIDLMIVITINNKPLSLNFFLSFDNGNMISLSCLIDGNYIERCPTWLANDDQLKLEIKSYIETLCDWIKSDPTYRLQLLTNQLHLEIDVQLYKHIYK